MRPWFLTSVQNSISGRVGVSVPTGCMLCLLYTSVLRIGLAIFSLLVLLGFGGIDSRSNPYVLRSGATYLEAVSYTHLFLLLADEVRHEADIAFTVLLEGKAGIQFKSLGALQITATDSMKVTDVNNVESYYKTTRIENLTTPDDVIDRKSTRLNSSHRL